MGCVLRKDRCRETRKAECEEVKENDVTANQGEAGRESGQGESRQSQETGNSGTRRAMSKDLV
jgi:hypothetical protein